jgi:hypothetical protein
MEVVFLALEALVPVVPFAAVFFGTVLFAVVGFLDDVVAVFPFTPVAAPFAFAPCPARNCASAADAASARAPPLRTTVPLPAMRLPFASRMFGLIHGPVSESREERDVPVTVPPFPGVAPATTAFPDPIAAAAMTPLIHDVPSEVTAPFAGLRTISPFSPSITRQREEFGAGGTAADEADELAEDTDSTTTVVEEADEDDSPSPGKLEKSYARAEEDERDDASATETTRFITGSTVVTGSVFLPHPTTRRSAQHRPRERNRETCMDGILYIIIYVWQVLEYARY